ncbi:hypothetical protein [Elioraea sp.]|uniref:hypothetical protein n=3 Tax=Elioraea sp. TaxID=2185103 RepID=UPI0026106658|nr:hypothetical protein [Elioraea sp.]
MRRAIGGWLAVAACGLALSGCAGFSGSGGGFGGFGASSRPAVPEDSYTGRRITGADDQVAPLQADTSVQWPRDGGDRASVFETEEERRARERRERQAERPHGSPAPAPRAERTDPARIVAPPPPREVAVPERDRRGEAIPGAPAGTVETGGTGRSGTFGGPAGSGTTVRDGGTMTLMGADGQIRTVPAPR